MCEGAVSPAAATASFFLHVVPRCQRRQRVRAKTCAFALIGAVLASYLCSVPLSLGLCAGVAPACYCCVSLPFCLGARGVRAGSALCLRLPVRNSCFLALSAVWGAWWSTSVP